ncbi:MAG: ATP-dependent protease LonB [Candidatus Heimdallarchaeota archaeon]|nr:MAG: ATP-dependent protease LonB [Candidatus Heimdallarchaeota archaeon]
MDEIKKESIEVDMDFETTQEIPIPSRLIDQVIGQDQPVEIIKKAAIQRRNVLLIGDPGTGKSMLGQALAELLPREELEDILCLPNQNDSHTPRIMTVPALEGRKIVDHYKQLARKADQQRSMLLLGIPALIVIIGLIFFFDQFLMAVFVALVAFFVIGQFRSRRENLVPKLLVDNSESPSAPFSDATGAHAGALLGDVRHDPFQSGGLGTPAHDRVEAGLIHKSHKGVLYIDEVATLNQKTQQQLLTAMQDRQLAITGQSELSSGAMVRTEAVPCDFVLVASGNIDTVRRMHPALRSRIRGYGYEIAVNHHMPDTMENRRKLVRFTAQEVTKDGKIPHFSRDAVLAIILEAKKRANRKGHLSLRLRDLGGLIRAAGDIAREEGVPFVEAHHILGARDLARSLENQIADKQVEHKKEYKVFQTTGSVLGRVNGLAVLSDPTGGARGGHITPIEAQVTPAQGAGGRVIATGNLRAIARESVQNVSALIKKLTGKEISKMDVHIQFLGVHGIDGDSASVSIATAIMSDLENLPVRQDLAMTGSLSVRGKVLPVGGTTAKIEGAYHVGIKEIIIPAANLEDVVLDEKIRKTVKVIPVEKLDDVLAVALVGWDKRKHVSDLATTPQSKSIPPATKTFGYPT